MQLLPRTYTCTYFHTHKCNLPAPLAVALRLRRFQKLSFSRLEDYYIVENNPDTELTAHILPLPRCSDKSQ